MATPKRWAIRDAGNATFFDKKDGHAIVTLRTLKTSGVETTGETTYARGGFGNAKLVGFSSNREATLSLTDAIFDNLAMAMLTGNDAETGAKEVYKEESHKVVGGKITLEKTPVGNLISVYELDSGGNNDKELTIGDPTTNPDEYTITSKDLTVDASLNGKNIRVYYKVTTDTDATTVKVTSDKFGGTFKVIVDLLVRDEETQQDYAAQLIIPNCKFEDSFNFDLSVDGDPASLDLTMEILKDPVSTDMWEMVIYDDETIA